MLFISAHTLDHASGDTHLRKDLRGGFYRSPLAAAAFTLGAANLVGVPMLSVFITKVTMAQAAVMTGGRHTVIALCALAISTLLNAYYFLGTTMQLYIPDHEHPERNARVKINVYAAIGLVGFIALNLTLSFCAQGIFGKVPMRGSGYNRFLRRPRCYSRSAASPGHIFSPVRHSLRSGSRRF